MHFYAAKHIAQLFRRPKWLARLLCALMGAGLLLASPGALTQSEEKTRVLQALTAERELLTVELEQYQKTLDVLQNDDTPPEQSSNPAVRKLAEEVVHLKERMIAIARQEVTLLQQQIIEARSRQQAAASSAREAALLAEADGAQRIAAVEPQPQASATIATGFPQDDLQTAIEGKPLRLSSVDYTLAQEAEKVERLHELLEGYHAEVQEASATLPTAEELQRREAARRDAETLAKIPFSADKVRLNGSEGSTALAIISERLSDPLIAESRRDLALICVIKTRLFGELVGSENRSLKPVGKNHYVARVRLQPGDTTLGIQGQQWTLRLPESGNGQDFLITLYRPPEALPVLHVFAVDDLLAQDRPHIPAWLPDELNLRPRRG